MTDDQRVNWTFLVSSLIACVLLVALIVLITLGALSSEKRNRWRFALSAAIVSGVMLVLILCRHLDASRCRSRSLTTYRIASIEERSDSSGVWSSSISESADAKRIAKEEKKEKGPGS
jgi:uncharacterized membrane protein YkvI